MLNGKPVIQHVYERVLGSSLFSDVIIATDDDRIAGSVKNFGGNYRMTRPDHNSGSDRIAEVISDIDCDVVFNIQGDEPLIDSDTLTDLRNSFTDGNIRVASLMTLLVDDKELLNINVVKVVTDNNLNALYFSRSPIPCRRDNVPNVDYFRHIGVYAYRKSTLLEFVKFPQGRLEQIEKLEQLRFLENNIPIRMVITNYQGIGIDTHEDLEAVVRILSRI